MAIWALLHSVYICVRSKEAQKQLVRTSSKYVLELSFNLYQMRLEYDNEVRFSSRLNTYNCQKTVVKSSWGLTK